MSTEFHWSKEYGKETGLTNKEKGDLGEFTTFKALKILKEELDLLASEPMRLARLKETDTYPDIYVEGHERGFLIEVKNWWSLYPYRVGHLVENIFSKQWNQPAYELRMEDGDAYRRGTIGVMKNGVSPLPVLVTTQVNTWSQAAKVALATSFGGALNNLVLTEHPLLPPPDSFRDCGLEANYRLMARLEKIIQSGDI